MKLVPPPPRVSPDDSVLHGMDAALTMLLFLAVGFVIDRWLGITPWAMIASSLLGGVGLFLKFKYRYDATMQRLETERRARVASSGPAPETP